MIFIVDEEAKIRGSHADENDLYHWFILKCTRATESLIFINVASVEWRRTHVSPGYWRRCQAHELLRRAPSPPIFARSCSGLTEAEGQRLATNIFWSTAAAAAVRTANDLIINAQGRHCQRVDHQLSREQERVNGRRCRSAWQAASILCTNGEYRCFPCFLSSCASDRDAWQFVKACMHGIGWIKGSLINVK